MKQLTFLLVFAFLFTTQSHAKNIKIDLDENDCINSWVSMDVTVRVDQERFSFNPSCKFSFSKNFKTKDGTSCTINAGMCSQFSPRNKLEVNCKDSFSKSVAIKCPTKK